MVEIRERLRPRMQNSHHHLPENIAIRRIWPTEVPLYRDHLKRLDADSRHSRFNGVVSDAFIDQYTESAYRPDALIFGAFDGEKIVAAGELRLLFDGWRPAAEAAFSVEKAYQDHGIGDALFHRLLVVAQNRNIGSISIICLRENDRMRHLAKKYSAQFDIADGEISGQLAPAWSSPSTYLEEAFGELSGLVKQFLTCSKRRFPFASAEIEHKAA